MSIRYYPVHVFPANPVLAHYIPKRKVIDRKDDGLTFEYGATGKFNILVTSAPVFMDNNEYNWGTKTWDSPQINLTISGSETKVYDLSTLNNNMIVFGDSAVSLYDNLQFYFKDNKITTNYDFSNVEDQKRVTVEYCTITKNLKVRAVLMTSSDGFSRFTPTVDQYTLVVGRQKS